MINPIDVEKQFQSLLSVLSYPAPSLQKLEATRNFLSTAEADPVSYVSYVRDCVPRLKDLLESLPRYGVAPGPIERLLGTVQRVEALLPAVAADAGFGAVLREVRLRLAELYLYAADRERARTVLGSLPPRGEERPPLKESPGTARDILLQWITEADRSGDPLTHHLRRIAAHWNVALALPDIGCYVPVIEHPLVEDENDTSYGTVRLLEFHGTGRVHGPKDELHSDVAVFGAHEAPGGPWERAAEAARSHVEHTHPRCAKKYIRGLVRFRGRAWLHEGRSADLAVAVLVVVGILREAGQREQYRLQPTVAITGEVDPEGTVLPVDGQALRLKVEAVWFSPVETLIVPREQLAVAEAFAADLAAQYPNRRLDILGVRHLRDVFYDVRAAVRPRTSILRHAARIAWRRKSRIVAGTATIALALALARLLLGPFDRAAAEVELAGTVLAVKNARGEVLSEIPVDRKSREALASQRTRGSGEIRRMNLLFGSDRRRSLVVFLRYSDPNLNGADEVRCWDIDAGKVRWDWRPNPDLHFPMNHEGELNLFNLAEIESLDVDRDGVAELLVTATHGPSFPSLLTVLDLETGREKGMYVHTGHIMDMAVADLDRDSVQEIILCGVNNAFRCAFVAVLDPASVSGCSPSRNPYRCSNVPPASEKHYLLIPWTDVGALSIPRVMNNAASAVVPDAENGLVTIRVDDGLVAVGRGDTLNASLNYTFGSSMTPLEIHRGDDYDAVADRLVRARRLARKPDGRMMEDQMRKIRYWNGQGWNSVDGKKIRL